MKKLMLADLKDITRKWCSRGSKGPPAMCSSSIVQETSMYGAAEYLYTLSCDKPVTVGLTAWAGPSAICRVDVQDLAAPKGTRE